MPPIESVQNSDNLPPRRLFQHAVLKVLSTKKTGARPIDVYDLVAEFLDLTAAQRARKAKDGKALLYRETIRLARADLFNMEALVPGKHGWWELSEKGFELAKLVPASGLEWQERLINAEFVFPEGEKAFKLHTTYERNQALVRRKKAEALAKRGSLACEVCDFDFSEHYGDEGLGYIECHHTLPVSEIHKDESKWGTSMDGLVLLCANCHRMAHYGPDLLSLEQMQARWHQHHPRAKAPPAKPVVAG